MFLHFLHHIQSISHKISMISLKINQFHIKMTIYHCAMPQTSKAGYIENFWNNFFFFICRKKKKNSKDLLYVNNQKMKRRLGKKLSKVPSNELFRKPYPRWLFSQFTRMKNNGKFLLVSGEAKIAFATPFCKNHSTKFCSA